MVFDSGELKEIDFLTGEEYWEFAQPIGKTDAAYLSHPEPASMALTFRGKGIQYIDIKMHMPLEFRQKLKLFWDLGFANSKPIKLGDKEIVQREILVHLVSKLPEEKAEQNDFGRHKR